MPKGLHKHPTRTNAQDPEYGLCCCSTHTIAEAIALAQIIGAKFCSLQMDLAVYLTAHENINALEAWHYLASPLLLTTDHSFVQCPQFLFQC